MEHYGITEIASLFGISTETVRRYEKKGILNTEQDQNNRYRKYDIWDVIPLFQTRTLREMGFSLEDVERILNKNSLWELHSAGEQYRIEYSPAMFAIEFSNETSLTENEKLQSVHREWIQKAPFVSCCALFGGQDMKYKKTLLVVEESCSDWIDKEGLKEFLCYIPSRLCVCLMLGAHYEGLIEEELRKQIRLMAGQGYKPDGDIIAKIIFMQRDKGVYYCNHKVWVPVKLI